MAFPSIEVAHRGQAACALADNDLRQVEQSKMPSAGPNVSSWQNAHRGG
jgi:hypothetical protein